MKCPDCGGNNIEFLSEYIETKNKYGEVCFGFGYVFCFILLIFGIAMNKVDLNVNKSSEIISALVDIAFYIASYSLGVNLILLSIKLAFILTLAFAIAPHKHETRIIAICRDCGEFIILSELNPSNEYDKQKEVVEYEEEDDDDDDKYIPKPFKKIFK